MKKTGMCPMGCGHPLSSHLSEGCMFSDETTEICVCKWSPPEKREDVVADVAMQILSLIDASPLTSDAERAAALASALAGFCKFKGFELIEAMNAFRDTWNEVTAAEVKLQ